jgi:hypothetical protein
MGQTPAPATSQRFATGLGTQLRREPQAIPSTSRIE